MNYGEIKAAVAYYLTRGDFDASQVMELAEQRIYYGEAAGVGNIVAPALRVSAMVKSATANTLPTDFVAMERVMSGRYRMDFLPWTEFGDYSQVQGVPRFYSLHGGQIALAPSGGSDPVAYTYYAKFAPLVADADQNWISINAPALYISSLMIEFAKKSRDDTLGQREAANYVSSLNALMSADRASQISGGALRQSVNMARR